MTISIVLIRSVAAVVTFASLLALGVDLAQTAYHASQTARTMVVAAA